MNQKLWDGVPETCAMTRLPGGSEAHSSLRTTALWCSAGPGDAFTLVSVCPRILMYHRVVSSCPVSGDPGFVAV